MQDKAKIETVSIRLSHELIKNIDVLISKGIYNSRSEAIREFCRNYVLRHRGKNE